jgi:carbon monoxide dehydrogenase subunit G
MPGFVSCERVAGATPPAVQASVQSGFSFLRTNLRLTMTLLDAEAPSAAALRIDARSIGTSLEIHSRIRIEPAADQQDGPASIVRWEAIVTRLSGLVAAVGSTVIRAAADKVVRDGWEALRRTLSDSAADTTGTPQTPSRESATRS